MGGAALVNKQPQLSSRTLSSKEKQIETGALSDYQWRNHWYAVGFEEDMPLPGSKRPLPYSIFDEPYVLFRDEKGALSALLDRCPHRQAKLSEGIVRGGRIECAYHGWRFDSKGTCVEIPQLDENASIPKRACMREVPVGVSEGIVFLWPGSPELATNTPLPRSKADLDRNGKDYIINSFVTDLPYSYEYLLENLIDPAHIPVSHDRTPGGGFIEDAQALDMVVDSITAQEGVRGRYRGSRSSPFSFSLKSALEKRRKHEEEKARRAAGAAAGVFEAALHCMPTGRGKSRLLFRTAFRVMPGLSRNFPQWMKNLNSCKILEQDLGLITSQEDFMRSPSSPPPLPAGEAATDAQTPPPCERNWEDTCLNLGTQDKLVVAVREWLDGVGPSLPYYEGWKSRSPPVLSYDAASTPSVLPSLLSSSPTLDPHHRAQTSRYYRHVLNSRLSRKALHAVERGQVLAKAVMAVSLAMGMLSRWEPTAIAQAVCAAGFLSAAAAAAGLSMIEKSFYKNFERHPKTTW
eukprot:jgi/Bigna1/40956/e_gw1.48.6.1